MSHQHAPVATTCSGLLAAFDWSATDLGDQGQWPHSLGLTLDIMFNSPLASILMWGKEQVMVYNQAYVDLLGTRQLRVPGATVPTVRPAVWSWNSSALTAAWAGQASAFQTQPLQIWRDGAFSEQHFDLFYTPVRDANDQVLGILCSLTAAVATPGRSEAAGLTVLVVEDNPDAQYLVCEMLRAFGHAVQALANAEDALGVLEQDRFDVLFTDVSLPGMSGVQLARRALARQPRLGIVFASGFGNELTRDLEFTAVSLQKPYELDALQDPLARAASQR